MGKGIDLAREDSPEHAQLMDDFKDQLLLALINRLGGAISIPVKEVDETGKFLLKMSIKNNSFHFKLEAKN